MISSQAWQFTIGLTVGALIIGGITSAKIFEKSFAESKNQQYSSRNDSFWPNSRSRNSSFWPNSTRRNSLYNYTTASRVGRTLSNYSTPISRTRSNYSTPISRTRSNYTASPFIRQQNRNLDFNYSRNKTRSVNRGVGVTYNL